jgi:RND family efflux transporter MFP subunit
MVLMQRARGRCIDTSISSTHLPFMPSLKVSLIAVCLLLGSLGSWYAYRGSVPAANASVPPSPTEKAQKTRVADAPVTVNVVLAALQDVPVELLASGSVVPLRTVELHPQTSSLLKVVHIKEGQFVNAGDLLFSLDDRNDLANLDKAQAQLARDTATLSDLERQYRRSLELVAQKFISQGAADTLQMQVQAQQALLQSDQAGVQLARIASGYASIRAPMAGRVGAIAVAPGSLVQSGTLLASLTQINPIQVSFTLPESSLQSLLQAQKTGPVAVQAMPTNSGKALSGTLSFIDNAVDPVAGTIRVKAQFDNSSTALWPGQYVNTSVSVSTLKNAVVVPLAAVVTNTEGKLVYSAEADQSAKARPVEVLYSFGTRAAVSGLAGGERIIVEGKQNLRAGSRVQIATAPDSAPREAGKKRQRNKDSQNDNQAQGASL